MSHWSSLRLSLCLPCVMESHHCLSTIMYRTVKCTTTVTTSQWWWCASNIEHSMYLLACFLLSFLSYLSLYLASFRQFPTPAQWLKPPVAVVNASGPRRLSATLLAPESIPGPGSAIFIAVTKPKQSLAWYSNMV